MKIISMSALLLLCMQLPAMQNDKPVYSNIKLSRNRIEALRVDDGASICIDHYPETNNYQGVEFENNPYKITENERGKYSFYQVSKRFSTQEAEALYKDLANRYLKD